MSATESLNVQPVAGKRKRTDVVDDASDKENCSQKTRAAKKRKAVKKMTGSVKLFESIMNGTAVRAAQNNLAKKVKKLYNDTLKQIDKDIAQLDKKVKTQDHKDIFAISTSNYAFAAGQNLGAVDKLADMDPVLAFNLLIAMADASHAHLDVAFRMSGEPGDQSIPTFTKLDAALLPLIEIRAPPPARATELPSVLHQWAQADANVGPLKTGRPNKQQRNDMYRQKLAWELERRIERRERRRDVKDGVAVALADLMEERDYLDKYGVEQYLPLSIARLEAYTY